MKSKKLCVGLLTYCDSIKLPKRFDIFKECLSSLKNIKSENVYIYAIDNGSSQDVVKQLKDCEYIDDVYVSSKNLYDVLAVNLLSEKAKQVGAEYVMHLEDDFLFYKNDFVDSCISFLEKHDQCGYVRILKYDFNNKDVYDKLSKSNKRDIENCQRHYNQITKNSLMWTKKQVLGEFEFYLNNWHWYNFANICKLSVFDKIIPKEDCYPLQHLEKIMIKKYHNLNLFTGVMDLGVVSHVGKFNVSMSTRHAVQENSGKNEITPIISIEEVRDEIKKLL